HFQKERDDLPVQAGNKIGDGGEVGPGVGRQRHEDNILLAALRDLPAGSNPSGVGIQNDLQQDGWIISRRTELIIVVASLEYRQVNLLVDEIVERVLEGPRQNLFIEEDGNELALGVVVLFVSRH